MAGISSLGVGSGIDIRSLVDQLVAAEEAPAKNRLDRQETTLQAKLSAFGTLKAAMSALQTVIEKLSSASSFRAAKGTSGNSEAIEVTGRGDVLQAAEFGIQIDALATAQSVASGAFASRTAPIGSGSLTFRFGTVTTDESGAVTGFTQNPERATATIQIPAEASTLEDVRDAINDADIGIRASVIFDGTSERLVFNATETGAANGFVVDVTDDDGNLADGAGLSRLQFNQSAADLVLNRAAGDASLVVDGLPVTRSDNEITDLLEGATLTLKETTTQPVNVRVEPDASKAKALIKEFVEGYNALQKQIKALSGYNPETQQGGVLQGNALVRSLESSLRTLVTAQVDVLDGQSVRALADIGIKTTREGTLEIDESQLDERLAESLEAIGALFGTGGLVEGGGFRYESSRTETQAGQYAVSVTQLAEQAAIVGTAVAAPSEGAPVTIDDDNDEIELTINGTATGRISLTHGSYASGAALAAELQARINGSDALREAGIGVTVEFDDTTNQFTVRTDDYGSQASVEVTFAESGTATTFGLTEGLTDSGVDVAGTIGGVAAEGFGRYLTLQTGKGAGLKLEITATEIGDLGMVRFSRGVSSLLQERLDSLLSSTGPLESVTKSLRGSIDDIDDQRLKLADRLDRLEARLIAQFTAMDAMVAQLNSTSSFLSSQLAGLEALARNAGRKDSK
ncbi:MAG TPA: flagellar filament capping protein FliD [Pseudomonadales bacterium]